MKYAMTFAFGVMLLCMSFASAEYLSVPEDYATIQSAVDSAQPGDTVLVQPGVYRGDGNRDIDLRGKDIVIRSRSMSWIDCESQAGDKHVGFLIISGESPAARVEGFTIENAGHGAASWAAGIVISNNSSPSIVDCMVLNSNIGIISEAGSNPEIADCIFYANSSHGIVCGAHARGSIINCLVVENGGNGMTFGHIGEPEVMNCTVASNSGFGVVLDESYTMFRSCIVWGNGSGSFDETLSVPDVAWCLVEGGHSGDNNKSSDPLFTGSGQWESYYLSQTAAAQPYDSPCLNSGHVSAKEVCFDTWSITICLDSLTTRTDDIPDIDMVDMGYHYSPFQASPPTPTSTPAVTPTPAFTATPTPPDGLMVELLKPELPLSEGDVFFAELQITNLNDSPVFDLAMFCLLELGGQYFYHPTWNNTPDWEILEVIPVGHSDRMIFEPFLWPEMPAPGYGRFLSALTDPDVTRIIGWYDIRDFSWN